MPKKRKKNIFLTPSIPDALNTPGRIAEIFVLQQLLLSNVAHMGATGL